MPLYYPWYESASGDVIEQGHIFCRCPVFIPPANLELDSQTPTAASISWEYCDVVVMTQTCDLVIGREKVTEVLFCPVFKLSEMSGHLATAKGKEQARRGDLPGYHLLAASSLPSLPAEVCVVEFRRVHTLPLNFVRSFAHRNSPRRALLPPYREHLAQAFARYFMRVGLPVEVPPFG